MKPYLASLINALVLIAMSAWGFFDADKQSITILIPAATGVLLLLLNNGVKRENKVVAHIAVLLTLLIFIALFMPMKGAIGRDDPLAMLRVGLMLVSTLFALIVFIKSFIDIRRQRVG
ncbi:MAG: hypothetical protein AAGH53_03335 [Pseudomonadota bacterium]